MLPGALPCGEHVTEVVPEESADLVSERRVGHTQSLLLLYIISTKVAVC